MTIAWVAAALLAGLLLGRLLPGGKPAPAAPAVPPPPAEDGECETAAVIAAIAAASGRAPESVRLLSLRERCPWMPAFMNDDGGQIDEKIPDKNQWKNV